MTGSIAIFNHLSTSDEQFWGHFRRMMNGVWIARKLAAEKSFNFRNDEFRRQFQRNHRV